MKKTRTNETLKLTSLASWLAVGAVAVCLPSSALAESGKSEAAAKSQSEAKPRAETAPNDSWVSLSGTVVSTSPDAFRLDHGAGVITVEMDDFDFFHEGHYLMDNDQVVVYGKVDDDLFEKRTIEASSVYVESLGTHFYANAADEEDFRAWTAAAPIVLGQVELTGTVTNVTGREFTVDTGLRRIQVDTANLTYNPMDDVGFLQIDIGDRVKVSGDIDDSLFDEREVSADWIIELG